MFGKQQRGGFAPGKRGDEETQVEVRVRDGLIRARETTLMETGGLFLCPLKRAPTVKPA